MKILLQFPEGLKQKALAKAKELEAEGNWVAISASPTFGACDLALDEARAIGADKLVHFGHSEFCKADFNVEYVECSISAPLGVLPLSVEPLDGLRRICLLTTIQHVHQLPEIGKFYESKGHEVVLNEPTGATRKPGQLLGCDAGNVAELDGSVDAFVYFGGGTFHPTGALMQTTKPFFSVDPFRMNVERLDRIRAERARRSKGRIVSALTARSFGILVSTKSGQYHMELATALAKSVEDAGLVAAILVANTFDFESLGNLLEFDAFVNTACPRLAPDDNGRLRKPLLSAEELKTVLDLRNQK
ncbi:2-(3-amino-3-carboxypropyl)histidine synthase [uncultured archaeon]|nr:2-(3-amino-3-carboxypropyl)histidine synthase [uncultured archaeon]